MTGTKVVKLKLEDNGQADKLPKLKDPLTKEIAKIFEETGYWQLGASGRDAPEFYYLVVQEKTEKYDVSPEELQLILADIEGGDRSRAWFDRCAGIFLTALVNNSSRDEFRITPQIKLDGIGYRLQKGKKITVDGDVGGWVGQYMEGGTLIVNGNADDALGEGMEDGRVIVTGSAGNNVGFHMADGYIEIGKETDVFTGDRAEGGKILVKGKVGQCIPRYEGGELWERDRKILPMKKSRLK
ncbi:MAG: hypothetical protein V1921_06610 [Candidatus Altiarchaeota archaeon]